MVAGQNGGTREGGGRWWQKLRPTVLERGGSGGIEMCGWGEEEGKRLSPSYTCAKVIAGAPGCWFARDKYPPGEPGSWCAGNNPGTAVIRT
jgi:hypothetical protein